ncbi:MAG TPA: hypothetical protein VIZ31_09105 [Vicinamibacteria bacterium]
MDDQGGPPVALDPELDGLRRFHRFPQGEGWQVKEEVGKYLHVVVAEALLGSPNHVGSDYSRTLSPTTGPAHNLVSFDCADQGPSGAVCDYAELFRDPASPPAVLAQLMRWLSARDQPFAKAVARGLGPAAPAQKALRGAFQDRLALPLASQANALAGRRFFGPRERAEIEALFDQGTKRTEELTAAVAALSPGAGEDRVREVVEAAIDEQLDRFGKEIPGSEELLGWGTRRRIHFRATVVMPGPILRANTCFSGDTATWEFEGEDLYLQGFDLRARAAMATP